MDRIIESSLGVNLKVLKFLHLYDSKRESYWDRVLKYVIYLTFMVHVPLLGSLHFLLEEETDLEGAVDNAFVLALMICYLVKLFPLLMNRERIANCMDRLDHAGINFNEKHQELMEMSCKICRRNSRIFLISVAVGTISWATKPLRFFLYKLPIDIWLPFDLTERKVLFCCAYIYVVLGIIYPATASAAIDPLIGGLACLASAHLRILKDNIEFLEEHAKIEGHKKFDRLGDKIRQCVNHHNTILHFAKEFEHCFSHVVFCQFVGSIFVICFCCFQLSMLEVPSMEFLSTFDYLLIFMAQIYFYCFYGTELFEESNSLTNAIYSSVWYEYDLKSRKALLMMMERSKKPIVLTAGKVFDLSLETFTTILRRSYSLLAVLNNEK